MIDDPTTLISLAKEIIDKASANGFVLRLFGSLAVRLSAPDHVEKLTRFRSHKAKDLDFIGLRKDNGRIRELLSNWGFDEHALSATSPSLQHLAFELKSGLRCDVCLEKLSYNQTVDVKDVISKCEYSLPASHLLLSKLQIVDTTKNDLIDIISLCRQVSNSSESRIVCDVLGRRWGFHHGAIMNIERANELLANINLEKQSRSEFQSSLSAMRNDIDNTPKSQMWKLRSLFGTRVPWYTTTDEFDPPLEQGNVD